MQEVSVNQLSPIEAELSIVVGKGEVEAQFEKFCKEIKDRVLVNGFRKGQAPINVIRQKFAKEIKAEVSSRIINTKTEAVIKEKGLKTAGNPALKEEFRVSDRKQWLGDFNLDGSFSYAITTELEPQLDVQNYAGLTVELDLPNSEAWIANRVLEIQKNFGESIQVDRGAQVGDEITVDYSGTVDGKLVSEDGANWKSAIIGSGEFGQEFESKLIGATAGSRLEFTIDYPVDSEEALVAGKKVDFVVNIHSVNEVKLHPLNDELAQKAVYENLDQMMSELKAKAEEEFDRPRRAMIVKAIMDQVLEKNTFQVPKSWVDNEMHVIAYKLGFREMPAEIEQLNLMRDTALRSVQQSFVLDKIYQKETQLHLTSEELQAALEKEAMKVGKQASEMLTHLKSTGRYEGFVSFIEHQKTTDFLISSTIVKEKA